MKIIVLFKTHLDIGFTDLSENVVKKYMDKYIPDAIRVGREIKALGRTEGFTWTTGSWLIWHYLKYADKNNVSIMKAAIRDRLISWHGLPFTLHSELMNGELFDYGLSLSKELDERFGKVTVGAKMTDVPGHTQAIVPHLCDAGISFLHIGINPASCPAELPLLFRWKYENRELAVMYESGDYGGFSQIPGTDVYIYFAHTGDNLGPQSAEEILKIYDDIHNKYPAADVKAGDLNDVAAEVNKVWNTLPVITQEVGDTWIHGIGSDPQKTTQFRTLLMLAQQFPANQKRKLYEHLLLVPEHTWGLDEKMHLGENRNYTRARFDSVRNDYKYKKMELSWAEQRRYILDGVNALDEPYRSLAEHALCEYKRPMPNIYDTGIDSKNIVLGSWRLSIDNTGAICALEYADKVIADNTHGLFGFSYDEYSPYEVWEYQERYTRASFWKPYKQYGQSSWAIDDFGKEGLCDESTGHTAYVPALEKVVKNESQLHIFSTFDEEAAMMHGCPKSIVMTITAEDNKLHCDFSYHGKCANRAPEALWLSFKPRQSLNAISKLGYLIDPADVVSNGARELHATDGLICFDGFDLISLDAPLVSVDGKHIYGFKNMLPDKSSGIYFNLFNNQWGTNFPMWTEGDRRFRFTLRLNDKL